MVVRASSLGDFGKAHHFGEVAIMNSWRIRELRSDDLEQVADLWNESMSGAYRMSSVDKNRLEAVTSNRQTFDREASFVAEEAGKLAGFIISFADQELENDGFWHMIVAGWIGGLIVGSSFRRRGLGSQLLEEAEKVHRNKGRLLLFVGGGEGRVHNLLPGLEEQWVDARQFFKHREYRFVRRTCYVNIDMSNYDFPQRVKAQQRELEARGFSIGRSGKEEEGAYERFCLDLKRPEVGRTVEMWWEHPGAYIVARGGGRIVGEVSGMYITERGEGGYGGITTLPEFRRRGIGKVMLATAVDFLRREGACTMPLWTRPATYEKFYAKLGFWVEKNYDVYGKMLPQDILSVDWIARYQDPR